MESSTKNTDHVQQGTTVQLELHIHCHVQKELTEPLLLEQIRTLIAHFAQLDTMEKMLEKHLNSAQDYAYLDSGVEKESTLTVLSVSNVSKENTVQRALLVQ